MYSYDCKMLIFPLENISDHFPKQIKQDVYLSVKYGWFIEGLRD